MTARRFISEEELLNDAFKLGVQIFNSGFKPSFVVGLWRGGSSVGIYVQECLQYLGIETDHIAIRTSYRGVDDYPEMAANPQKRIRVHGTQYLLESLNADDRLLLVDDVYSSGQTLDVVRARLKQRLKRNMPEETRTATIWTRAGADASARKPDYFLHETNSWLVLPYEISGLSEEEIKLNKPLVAELVGNSSDSPKEPYSPINCGDYDYLEIACMDQYELDLKLTGAADTAARGTAKRLETRSGEEFLWLSDENGQEHSVRIDTIERMVVVTRPARFTEHQFGA